MAVPNPKKHYLAIILLSLSTFFIFSHYFLSPPHSSSPSFSNPTHFLSPTSQKFTFTIKILAFDRLPSLSRCLRSLSAAHYGGDTVNLHIFIDHFTDLSPKLEDFRRILDFVDGFEWISGRSWFIIGPSMWACRPSGLRLGGPAPMMSLCLLWKMIWSFPLFYYQFLKRLIVNYYYNQSNFSHGFIVLLCRDQGKHGNKMKLDSETRLFLYQLVGTWGQLLFPKSWKEFRLWYDDHKARDLKPFLDGMDWSILREMASAKRLIPTLNRILVEKIAAPAKTTAGILLPESSNKLNSGKVIAVGPGTHTNDGKLISVSLKEGDTVLLPEYGGSEFKLQDKTYHLYREDDILGTLHD